MWSFLRPPLSPGNQSDFLARRGYLQRPVPGMINPWTPYGFPQNNFGHIDPNRTSFSPPTPQTEPTPPTPTVNNYYNYTIIQKPSNDKKKKENPTNQSEEFAGLLADDVLKTYQCPHISV